MSTKGSAMNHVTKLTKDEAAELVTRLCREAAALRADNTALREELDRAMTERKKLIANGHRLAADVDKFESWWREQRDARSTAENRLAAAVKACDLYPGFCLNIRRKS